MTLPPMNSAPLPSKSYFRIGEVAEVVGVEPHVLRYWEREFRTIRPCKSAKGQRVYSRRDVEALLQVRELLYGQGFTIAGAKKQMLKAPEENALEAPPSVRDDAHVRTQLLALRSEVEEFLHRLGKQPTK